MIDRPPTNKISDETEVIFHGVTGSSSLRNYVIYIVPNAGDVGINTVSEPPRITLRRVVGSPLNNWSLSLKTRGKYTCILRPRINKTIVGVAMDEILKSWLSVYHSPRSVRSSDHLAYAGF